MWRPKRDDVHSVHTLEQFTRLCGAVSRDTHSTTLQLLQRLDDASTALHMGGDYYGHMQSSQRALEEGQECTLESVCAVTPHIVHTLTTYLHTVHHLQSTAVPYEAVKCVCAVLQTHKERLGSVEGSGGDDEVWCRGIAENVSPPDTASASDDGDVDMAGVGSSDVTGNTPPATPSPQNTVVLAASTGTDTPISESDESSYSMSIQRVVESIEHITALVGNGNTSDGSAREGCDDAVRSADAFFEATGTEIDAVGHSVETYLSNFHTTFVPVLRDVAKAQLDDTQRTLLREIDASTLALLTKVFITSHRALVRVAEEVLQPIVAAVEARHEHVSSEAPVHCNDCTAGLGLVSAVVHRVSALLVHTYARLRFPSSVYPSLRPRDDRCGGSGGSGDGSPGALAEAEAALSALYIKLHNAQRQPRRGACVAVCDEASLGPVDAKAVAKTKTKSPHPQPHGNSTKRKKSNDGGGRGAEGGADEEPNGPSSTALHQDNEALSPRKLKRSEHAISVVDGERAGTNGSTTTTTATASRRKSTPPKKQQQGKKDARHPEAPPFIEAFWDDIPQETRKFLPPETMTFHDNTNLWSTSKSANQVRRLCYQLGLIPESIISAVYLHYMEVGDDYVVRDLLARFRCANFDATLKNVTLPMIPNLPRPGTFVPPPGWQGGGRRGAGAAARGHSGGAPKAHGGGEEGGDGGDDERM